MFEIHVTVKNASEEAFDELCASQKARAILIELPATADCPEQLMCSKWVTGTLDDAKMAAKAFSAAATSRGFLPVREKIEMAFSGAPDEFVPRKEAGEYWEFHYKLHMAPGDLGDDLREVLGTDATWGHVARMSRSALRDTAPDGGVFRIVTLRLYSGDKAEARHKYEALKAWLVAAGYNVIKIQRELAVYDDHLKLDQGWL